jgi:membrane-bound ClpP family serine protease
MTGIILLFALGIVLLFFEAFVPGAVLGILGGIFLLIGCGLAFADYGATGGALAVAIAAVLAGLMFYFEFFVLPKTRLGKKMFLQTSIAGASHAPVAQSSDVVGRNGEALTTLAPSGFVLIDGKRYEASSQSGLIEQGAAVKVTGLNNFQLIVSKS